MATSICTSIFIESSPQRVWQTLTDFSNYSHWSKFILSIEGIPEKDENLKVVIQPSNGSKMVFKPQVKVASEDQELKWLGKLLIKGLFDGEHTFRLEHKDNGTVFHHSEIFNGLLVPLLRSSLKKTEEGFHLFNEALKSQCESNES